MNYLSPIPEYSKCPEGEIMGTNLQCVRQIQQSNGSHWAKYDDFEGTNSWESSISSENKKQNVTFGKTSYIAINMTEYWYNLSKYYHVITILTHSEVITVVRRKTYVILNWFPWWSIFKSPSVMNESFSKSYYHCGRILFVQHSSWARTVLDPHSELDVSLGTKHERPARYGWTYEW